MAFPTGTCSKRLGLFLVFVIVLLTLALLINISETNKYTLLDFPIFKFVTPSLLARKYCYKENRATIIFLHVTNKSDEWHPIEMCAFRTAAILNNETGVCVLTKSKMKPHPALASLSNLEFGELNSGQLFENTTLQQWYRDYALNASRVSSFFTYELSDALRLAYLYKYGGKYMDTDSWTLRNLAPLQNVAGWQGGESVANGVMFFEKAHPFVNAALEAFPKLFAPGVWGSVGPKLITGVHKSGLVNNSTYTILESHDFYPFLWQYYYLSFEPNKRDYVKSIINGSYTMHLYRFMIEKHTNPYPIPPPNGSFADEFLNNNCSLDNWRQ